MGEDRFAFLFNTSTQDVPQTINGFEYAIDLAEAGHTVDIYLDGAATSWPEFISDHPDSPVGPYYQRVKELGLIVGACGLCAVSRDNIEYIRDEGIELLGDEDSHGVRTSALVSDGYELVVIS